jgi:hypothetical protein
MLWPKLNFHIYTYKYKLVAKVGGWKHLHASILGVCPMLQNSWRWVNQNGSRKKKKKKEFKERKKNK